MLVDFHKPSGSDSEPSKEAAQGGGEPPATGMARDYDYLFKLLIIGDSGKPIPGMLHGKWALSCFYFLQGEKEKCCSGCAVHFSGSVAAFIHFYLMHGHNLKCINPPYFCGGDRAEVMCVRAGYVSRSGRISPPDLRGKRTATIITVQSSTYFSNLASGICLCLLAGSWATLNLEVACAASGNSRLTLARLRG